MSTVRRRPYPSFARLPRLVTSSSILVSQPTSRGLGPEKHASRSMQLPCSRTPRPRQPPVLSSTGSRVETPRGHEGVEAAHLALPTRIARPGLLRGATGGDEVGKGRPHPRGMNTWCRTKAHPPGSTCSGPPRDDESIAASPARCPDRCRASGRRQRMRRRAPVGSRHSGPLPLSSTRPETHRREAGRRRRVPPSRARVSLPPVIPQDTPPLRLPVHQEVVEQHHVEPLRSAPPHLRRR